MSVWVESETRIGGVGLTDGWSKLTARPDGDGIVFSSALLPIRVSRGEVEDFALSLLALAADEDQASE